MRYAGVMFEGNPLLNIPFPHWAEGAPSQHPRTANFSEKNLVEFFGMMHFLRASGGNAGF